MKAIKLTAAQEKIETQNGSIYVRINGYYTATVRNLTSFVQYINENRNDLDKLQITNVGEVSEEFKKAVRDIIKKANNPNYGQERLIENVEMFHHDTEHKTFKIDVVVRWDGKVKLLFDTFNGEWRQHFQTPKETGRGHYVTLYGSRVYFTYDVPIF